MISGSPIIYTNYARSDFEASLLSLVRTLAVALSRVEFCKARDPIT